MKRSLSMLLIALVVGASAACKGDGAQRSSETGPSCETEFSQEKYRDKWQQCMACERQHRGMGTMEADCKKAIAKPWK